MHVLSHSGKKKLPNACAEKFAHGMDTTVPVIEITHYADSLGVRRPDCKINAVFAIERAQMSAEFVVDSPVLSFGKEIQIGFAHDRAIPVRITRRPLGAGGGGKMKLVIQVPGRPRHLRAEKSVPMNLLSFEVAI